MLAAFQPWQPAFGSFLGLIAIFVAAAMGFRFNRRRDEYLRENEIQSVAAALYAEILTLRKYAARMANHVAARYEDHGLGRRRGEPFDAHFFEMVPMPNAAIYTGLSSEIGKLPANLLLGVVQFYSYYEETRYWLPRLEEKEERGFSYGVLHVLRPALNAVEGIQPTLDAIEALAGISPPAVTPDLKRAKNVANWEEEQWAEIREQTD
jgi:hypothetical protein